MLEKLEAIKRRFEDVEVELSSPTAMSDMKRFAQLNKEYKELSKIVAEYLIYSNVMSNIESNKEILATEKDEEFREMAKAELDTLIHERDKMEEDIRLMLIPSDPEDAKNAILEIRAGTGGDEASLFAGDVYGTLKYESGVHRVQRVPATETQGRVHTSAASIVVLPEADEFDIDLKVSDIRKDFFCSSGPGGQSVNTTYSAVRLTHVPTGIVAQCQDEKSQHKNYDKALSVLRSRIYEMEYAKHLNEVSKKRKTMVATGDRSAKIRTYNYPQSRLTEHRIGLTSYNLNGVMNGDIQDIIDGLQFAENAEKLKEGTV